jgi:hypothetical protein
MQKFWSWVWYPTLCNILGLVTCVGRRIKWCIRDHTHSSKCGLLWETEPTTHICRWQIVIVWHTMIIILLLGIIGVNHWWLLIVTPIASFGLSLFITIDQLHRSFLMIPSRCCRCHPWHRRLLLLLLLVLLVLAIDSLFLFILRHHPPIVTIPTSPECLSIVSLIFSIKRGVIKCALEQGRAFLPRGHTHPSLLPSL